MLSTSFAAEELTTVTTVQQEAEGSSGVGSEADARGYLRITTKVLAIPMPRNSELYRLRLRTQAYAYNYLRMRFSNVPVLATITPARFQEFQEYLFGKNVWGMGTRDEHDRITSTPTMLQVMGYERAIRKDVAHRMNGGQDWWAAMEEATACPRLLQVHFLSPVAMSPQRTVTAPGIAPFQTAQLLDKGGDRGGNKRTNDDMPPPNHKADKSKAKRQRKQAEFKALKDAAHRGPPAPPAGPGRRQLALEDGGKGRGGGKAGGKGGKADPFPAGCHKSTPPPANKGICIGYNLVECKFGPGCRWEHVCWWCLEAHSGSTCPKKVIQR